MPLPFHPVREDPDRAAQALIPGNRCFRDSAGKAFVAFDLTELEFRILLQQVFNRLLILLRGKCTGRIQDHTARFQHLRGLCDDAPLDLREKVRSVFFPGADHLPVFAEHAFTGTGGVDQDLVEVFCEIRDQFSRFFTQYEHVSDAHQFNVLKQAFCAGITQVIGCQHPAAVQFRPQLGRFSAGSRAYVQHPVSRINGKTVCRRHGARFLQIVKSGVIIRVFGRLDLFAVIIESVADPRNRFERPGRDLQEIFHGDLCRIDPEPVMTRFIKTVKVASVLFFTE